MVEWICRALLIIAVWKLQDVHSKPCFFRLRNSSEIISSNSSGNCTNSIWEIKAPVYHKIRLKFVTFQITDNMNSIRVFKGRPFNNANMLGYFNGTRKPYTVESNNRFMLVLLTKKHTFSLCNFKAVYSIMVYKVKPRIWIPIPVLRTVPNHYIWCNAEGTPSINMSLFNSSTLLATGKRMVMAKISQEGNYTCMATNNFGTDSRHFLVTITGCRNSCLSYGKMSYGRVKNMYNCSEASSIDDIFNCIPTTATHMILKRAKIKNLPMNAFRHMHRLNTLNLEWNEIQHLPKGIFSKLTLNVLRLGNNLISSISNEDFSNLRRLQYLKLTSNQIQEVPSSAFSNLARLYFLDLASNRIKHLPVGVFYAQRILFSLNLAGNKLVDIPAGLFTKQRGLLFLYLQNNLIRSISSEVFSNLTNLQYLLLNENRLRIIPDQAFRNLESLKILMLSDNSIETVGSEAFTVSNKNKLVIYMIRTALENVSSDSFNNISNLKTIIGMYKGKIATVKFMDANQKELCTVHLGFGQDEVISLFNLPGEKSIFIEAFGRAGFAKINHDDHKKILPCPVGTFVNPSVSDPNDLKCTECPAGGYYSDTKAFVSESCLKCPNGTFVHFNKAPGESARDCMACPQGTDTNLFAGFRACTCLKGFFRTHLFEGCRPCHQNGLKCVDDYVILQSGYWWKWKNGTHKTLYEQFTITLINNTVIPIIRMDSSSANPVLLEYPYTLPRPHKCPREESCKGGIDSSCDLGYEGPLCEVCSTGYYKQFQTCKSCPTNKWMVGQFSVLAAAIAIISFAVFWTSKKKSEKSKERSTLDLILGRLKIVIGFYQVTFGLLEAFSYIKWPDSIAIIGKYSELLQLNVLQIAPVHCLFPHFKVDAFGSLFALLSINAAAIIVAFVIYGLTRLFLMRKTLREEEKIKKISHTKKLIYRNLFFFLYVTYLSTCSKTANVLPLACHKLCFDEEEQNCQKFLKADYTFECTGTTYNRLVNVAYCAVLYIILLPTASVLILWRQRRAPSRNEMEANNKTCDAKDKTTELVTGLRFLFENYNAHSWYWELVETVRKVVLTSGLILVGGESRAYVGLACVMSGLYGMLFAYKRPIVDPFENKLMLTSLAVTFVNLGIGAVSKIPKEGIPSSIDPYVDNIMFRTLVFGANSLVIGLLVVQYIIYLYRYMAEWRKNPRWSFSCCLALLLPLNDLQGEIRGLAGRNILKNQLHTGKIDMPSMSKAFKDSGAVDFVLEDDATSLPEERNRTQKTENRGDEAETLLQRVNWPRQSDLPLAECTVTIHEGPRKAHDTTV